MADVEELADLAEAVATGCTEDVGAATMRAASGASVMVLFEVYRELLRRDGWHGDQRDRARSIIERATASIPR